MTDLVALFPDKDVRDIIETVLANNNHVAEGHETNYNILDHDKKVLVEKKKQACYAQVPNDCWANKNKFRYVSALQRPTILNEKDSIRWLQLCKESGAIGDTQQFAEEIYHQGLMIDLMNPYWTMDRLYVTFCNYRFLREAVTMVNNIITLVDNANVPFWHAFTFSHGHSFNSLGHSWLGWGNSQYSTGPACKEKQNLWFIRFLNDLLKKKNIKPLGEHFFNRIQSSDSTYAPGWTVANYMVTDKTIAVKDRVEMLTEKSVAALKAETFKEAKRIFNE